MNPGSQALKPTHLTHMCSRGPTPKAEHKSNGCSQSGVAWATRWVCDGVVGVAPRVPPGKLALVSW